MRRVVSETHQQQFGRADGEGNVYLITGDGERWVGQVTGATAEEALAFYSRKFQDLVGQVTLAEQRARTGAKARDVRKSVAALDEALKEPAVVGDLDALRTRVDALRTQVDALESKQQEQSAQAVAEAAAQREAIVEKIEQLAATPVANIRWKDVHGQVEQIFGEWKEHQRTTARLPKQQADALWARFKQSRRKLEDGRRAFFAGLDEQHRTAKQTKQQLVEEAQKLAEQAEPRVNDYRALLDRWKAAGRAGAKVDDRLWEQFKAAGDVIFAKKQEHDAVTDAEYAENLQKKEGVLTRAEALLPVTDWKAARSALRRLQDEWDEIGRVPRASMRSVEARLHAVETAVKEAEDAHWSKRNSEKSDRATGLAAQLQQSIADLETELADAQAAGDDKKAAEVSAALETQRSWLKATGIA
nr:DUF349 domain-containing protein [Pseudoclavibacter sp. 13-3]